MKNSFLLLLLFFLSLSCGTSGSWAEKGVLRATEELPVIAYPPGLEDGEEPCRNPLIDVTDGTELQLVRFTNEFGDYEAPEGKYGLQSGELLRINCQTLEVLGIVQF